MKRRLAKKQIGEHMRLKLGGPFPSLESENESSEEKNTTPVAFFFGAGASIEAGVPDTYSFVDAFLDSLTPDDKIAIQKVIEILNQWASRQTPSAKVDIELLLDALQRLADKEQDVLLAFFEGKQSTLPASFIPGELLKKLRDFIKSKVIVDSEAIKYLAPLRSFIQEFRPLDIYSANYDTCIEQLCAEHKLVYRDGFDEAWNPDVFEGTDIDIRLFKLHGSITWYRSDRGRYLKIPVMIKESSIELITKERAESLMLYPAQKFEYVEPLFELLIQMKQRLLMCRTLIVVGYSFRDDHIRNILWDVARQNKGFLLVLIDPNAWGIYQKRLKTYNRDIPSPLDGRVICLPYLYGKVLPVLKNEIFRNIAASQKRVIKERANEIAGSANWSECLSATALAGDHQTLIEVLKKIPEINDRNYGELVISTVLGLFHAVANHDNEAIKYIWGKHQEVVLNFLNTVEVKINSSTSILSIQPISFASYHMSSFIQSLNDANKRFLSRKDWTKDLEFLNVVTEFLKEFLEVISVWAQGTVKFTDYTISRKSHAEIKQLEEELGKVSGTPNSIIDGVDLGAVTGQKVTAIEKQIITEVLTKHTGNILKMLEAEK